MRNSQGFTLVELLVAMVAGSMLLAALSWTLTTLGRELKSSRQAESRQRGDSVAPVLSALIEQMLPAPADAPPLVAGPRRLAFETMAPAALGGGPVRVVLTVRAEPGGEALLAHFKAADAAAPLPPPASSERRLVEGYRRIRFAYAMPTDTKSGLPPKLVTISLTGPDGRSVRIAAAPRLNSRGDCRFDPVSMTCRR